MLMGNTRWRRLLAIMLLAALTACGGGGGGDDAPPVDQEPPGEEPPGEKPPGEKPPENTVPTALVQFPLSGGWTTGGFISLRGSASDPDGDEITQVAVNGVLAESDDGFATWRVADRALLDGANTLEVTVRDANGGIGTASITLDKTGKPGMALRSAGSMAYDPNNGQPRLLVPAGLDGALLAVNAGEGPNRGHRSIISRSRSDDEVRFLFPGAAALDSVNNRALVLDPGASSSTGRLIAVDMVSGERSNLLNGLDYPISLAFDAANNRALIGDSGETDKLLSLDLSDPASGTSNVVAAAFPTSIDLQPGNPDRALLVNHSALFDVDIPGKGISFIARVAGARAATFYPGDTSRALVVGNDALFEVNLGDGSKTLLSGQADSEAPRVGLGPYFVGLEDLVLDPSDSNRVFVRGRTIDRIFSVDLTSGDRTALAHSLGDGPEILSPLELAFLPASADLPPVLVAIDGIGGYDTNLKGISLAAGESLGQRVALSGFDAANPDQPNIGTGPTLIDPFDLVADPANGRLLVAEGALDAVIAVDLATGNRSIISQTTSGEEVGSGPSINGLTAIALDAANNRALVALSGSLVAVDLASGDRTLLSKDDGSGEGDLGSGPEMLSPRSLALDADNNRLLVAGFPDNRGVLMSIDLQSGDRRMIASDQHGAGPLLSGPKSVFLDAANNRALVLDSTFGGIVNALVAVDLDSGDRTILSGIGLGPDGQPNSGHEQLVGGGSALNEHSRWSDAALDAENQVVYVSDEGTGSVIAIDIASGDRVLVSGFGF